MSTRVLAVDLGASSARVVEVDLDRPHRWRVLHRHHHQPERASDGSLRWDWPGLVAAVEHGLALGLADGPVASIGIDTWGVDYGLVDRDGRLLSLPHSYRDPRTAGWLDVVERLGAARLYATTGIQLMPINTIFQLAAHDPAELSRAHRLLLLPDLLVSQLSGRMVAERTAAGTTGLVDAVTGSWAADLVDDLDIDPGLLPHIHGATTPVGSYEGVPIHLVGSHDTASAIAALPGPPAPGAAFVSSGTWFLVGRECPAPILSEAARLANFSNEPGVMGGVRLLKNVTGLWLLERCRDVWGTPPLPELVEAAERVPAGPRFDPNDERISQAPDVAAAICDAAGLPRTAAREMITRCVLDSLVDATATVLQELETLLGAPATEVHMLGGGVRLPVLRRLMENRLGIPVRPGSSEATAVGNALVQGIALGRWPDLDSARRELVVTA